MPRFRRRPEYVDAERFTLDDIPDGIVCGQDGIWRVMVGDGIPRVIKPGHWVVTDEHGTVIVMRHDFFDATYEAA